uniref:Uncharacterized protein n=1 Tax=Stegastes partitus TaxID=144197 RepID=A0A3B4ZU24_9TELE
PIWSMTCEPFFFRPASSCSLILMMRLAIPWTSSSIDIHINASKSLYHSERRSSTLFASSASLHTTVKPPTRSPSPMFLAKDWDSTMLWPCSMKRTAQASRSMSPLAKP